MQITHRPLLSGSRARTHTGGAQRRTQPCTECQHHRRAGTVRPRRLQCLPPHRHSVRTCMIRGPRMEVKGREENTDEGQPQPCPGWAGGLCRKSKRRPSPRLVSPGASRAPWTSACTSRGLHYGPQNNSLSPGPLGQIIAPPPIAPGTNYNKRGDLHNTHLSSGSCGGPMSEMGFTRLKAGHWQGCAPSGGSGGRVHSLVFLQLL